MTVTVTVFSASSTPTTSSSSIGVEAPSSVQDPISPTSSSSSSSVSTVSQPSSTPSPYIYVPPTPTQGSSTTSSDSSCLATDGMTMTFDDLEVHPQDPRVTSITLGPSVGQITGYYRGLFLFANSAVFAPAPDMSFAPDPNNTVSRRLVVFTPADGGNITMGAPNDAIGSFWFHPKSIMLGCSTPEEGDPCSVELTFFSYDNNGVVVTRNRAVSLNKCADNTVEKCMLQRIDLTTDYDLPTYGVAFHPIANGQKGTVYIDRFELGWHRTDPEAQQLRCEFQRTHENKQATPAK